MNFLILSKSYCGNVIYKRLKEENHDVWLCNPYGSRNGISVISNIYVALNNHIDAAIVTDTGFTKEAHILENKGIKVFGGQELQDKLELDTEAAQKLCKRYGLRLLKTTTNILMPLSITLWFANGEPLYQYIASIKQTKFLTGDLGPDVDCESIVLFSYPNRDVEVVDRIFNHGLFDALKAIHYTGIFTLDTFISSDDKYPYISKVIPRLETGLCVALLEVLDAQFGELILKIINKEEVSIILKDTISCAVAVSVPPYPYNQEGLITYIVSSGDNWIEARRKAGKKIRELNIENIQYRIDGGMQGEHIETLKRINYYNN